MERFVNYISEAHYKELSARFAAFHDSLGDPARPVVRVYGSRTTQQLQELQLVRDISTELQKRKQENMEKAAEVRTLFLSIRDLYPSSSSCFRDESILFATKRTINSEKLHPLCFAAQCNSYIYLTPNAQNITNSTRILN